MGRNPGKLSEKHWKAIELISQGQHTIKKVAEIMGWHPQTLYDLYEGNFSKKGHIAVLFHSELKKIKHKRAKEIEMLAKTNLLLAHEQINRILKDIEAHRTLTLEDRKLVVSLMNCLSKASPNVEIDKVSFSYTKNLTVEELIYEFKRLKTLAEGPFNRPGTQDNRPS